MKLDELFAHTNFSEEAPVWSDLEVDEDGRPFISECSTFGDTLIQMAGVYERGGYDGLFLQELVRLYCEGKIIVTEGTSQ